MRLIVSLTVSLLFVFNAFVFADVPEYIVKKTTEKVVIDGILDEQDWAAAKSVGAFQFPWYKEGDKEQTEVKIMWDDTFLYLAYKCDDKNIWADNYDTNSNTCLDDCVELFWNPNPKAGDMYNMFEINCLGNLLSVNNNQKRSIKLRESRIMVPHIAQAIKGTVNNDQDTDEGWVIEMAVRFSDYPELFNGQTPKPGDFWRIGLNRCGGKINQQYSQWSPSQTPAPNFHAPKDFGKIIFSKEKVR